MVRMLGHHLLDAGLAGERKYLVSLHIVRGAAGADEVHAQARRRGGSDRTKPRKPLQERLDDGDARGQQGAGIDHMKKPILGIVEKGRRRCLPDDLEVPLRTADRHGCGHGAPGDAGITLQHAGEIARCDARDQCGVANRPRLQNARQLVVRPCLAERSQRPRRVADPGILVVDAVGDAETAMDHTPQHGSIVRGDRDQEKIDRAPGGQITGRLVGPPQGPDAEITDQPDRPGRQRPRVDDFDLGRHERRQRRVETLLVIARIGRDDRGPPAEFRQVLRPQARAMDAGDVARREVGREQHKALHAEPR